MHDPDAASPRLVALVQRLGIPYSEVGRYDQIENVRQYLRTEIAVRRGESVATESVVTEVEPTTEEFDWNEVLKDYTREELASYGVQVP